MSTAFLWQDRIAAAWLGEAGPACIPALPLSNVVDPQPRVRARWTTTTGIQIWGDFGSSVEISCFALIGTTLGFWGGSTTVRVQISDDPGFATAAWDTGTVSPATDAYSNGNVVLVHATRSTGRYLFVEIDDPDAEVVDVGRLMAGPLWRPTYSFAYGMREGRMILDRRDRNPHTGAEFPVAAVYNPRQALFDLPYVSPADAKAEWRTMLDALGAVGDVLWIPDDGLSQAELNRRSIFGSAVAPGESALLQRAGFLHHTRSFALTERV